ncbi:UPF0547 protein C16orf87 homolog [Anopheles ziemanni]|uniref:AGAP001428-PA-like protein n=1 Tax=Anopheles sinensis TaxID=74873 RepID=A0A084VW38_ANOSI|nr:UPF0547 protein C16orf87 homolog [Anopheles coustani]XP_058173303.1 UPF0547 protein C16orf87 homolog [Anopheles ziemanni]KFB42182.1 AGAP001428-PA-like protein [Anopheles sinensis]
MVKTRMITKHCPECEVQVAIASKKCSCGHVFSMRQSSATVYEPPSRSKTGPKRKAAQAASSSSDGRKGSGSGQVQRRRTSRVRREKPNYYDSLQYEKKKKKTKKSSKTSLIKGKDAKQAQLITAKETQVARANRHANRRAKKEEIDGGGDLAAKLPLDKQEVAAIILSEINRKIGSVVWTQP